MSALTIGGRAAFTTTTAYSPEEGHRAGEEFIITDILEGEDAEEGAFDVYGYNWRGDVCAMSHDLEEGTGTGPTLDPADLLAILGGRIEGLSEIDTVEAAADGLTLTGATLDGHRFTTKLVLSGIVWN